MTEKWYAKLLRCVFLSIPSFFQTSIQSYSYNIYNTRWFLMRKPWEGTELAAELFPAGNPAISLSL